MVIPVSVEKLHYSAARREGPSDPVLRLDAEVEVLGLVRVPATQEPPLTAAYRGRGSPARTYRSFKVMQLRQSHDAYVWPKLRRIAHRMHAVWSDSAAMMRPMMRLTGIHGQGTGC